MRSHERLDSQCRVKRDISIKRSIMLITVVGYGELILLRRESTGLNSAPDVIGEVKDLLIFEMQMA